MSNEIIDAIIFELKRLQKAYKKENHILKDEKLTVFTAGQKDGLALAILICENYDYYLMKYRRNNNRN